MKRSAFTMIELIFVIIVIGILAAVAIPKFAKTRDDAQIAKGRSDIAAIRSAITNERQTRLLRGDSSYIATLDGATLNAEGVKLFEGNLTATPQRILLAYPITSKNDDGGWMKSGANTYTFSADHMSVPFTYTPANGHFDCDQNNTSSGPLCQALVN